MNVAQLQSLKFSQLRSFAQRFEPWIAGIYFAYFLGFEVPPPLVPVFNALSYVVLALLILISGCWKQLLFAMTRDIPLLLLHIMAVLSVIWSAAPDVTSIESKSIVRAAIFGLYLAVRFGLDGQMKLLARIMGIGVVLSLIAGVVFPAYGIHTSGEYVGSWKGIFGFKNLFASQMAFSVLLFLFVSLRYPRWRWLTYSIMGIAVALLLLSRGKTALAALLISLYLLPLYAWIKQHYKVQVILAAIATLISLALVVIAVENARYVVVDLLGKNLEFNGRLPIWGLMLDQGMQRPWFGFGYSAFWTSDASYYIVTQTWAAEATKAGLRFNAHSGYIELFLHLGFVGLALYLLSLGTLLFRTLYLFVRLKSIEIFWVLETLIYMSLTSFADSLSVGTGGGQWSLYIAFATTIAMMCRRLKLNDRDESDASESYSDRPAMASQQTAALNQ